MDSTLQALGGILVRAIPTFVLVVLLHLYLKRMFFGPLEKVLGERREATEGAREAAETALRRAEEKAAGYEAALREARAAMYKEQEEVRGRWVAEQGKRIQEARAAARALVAGAGRDLAVEVERARAELGASSEALAAEIAQGVLSGGVN